MKHVCTLISVADINASRKFYEDLFGLEVFQDYGRNIAFTCGLAATTISSMTRRSAGPGLTGWSALTPPGFSLSCMASR